ncbi:MAG TPA: PPOX class F420-dependent oxidoreductase [Candidatus Nitrosopolaris sp.]|nr:PPOX class F420-dependent oxidoreductase [Candidatus Nitrosopolaris sp.]
MKSDKILERCRTYKREVELSGDSLGQFLNQKYINLETCKQSGQAIHTPVWFVDHKGVIYVRTDKNSGKVKRVRNNPHVRIMPCDIRGRPKGEWIHGTIQIANDYESQQANTLLNQKYGLRGKILGIMYKFRKIEFLVLSIHFNADETSRG